MSTFSKAKSLGRNVSWRQVIRVTMASVLAYVACQQLGLPEPWWAVITALLVVQNTLGATLDASLTRLQGTVAGAALAVGMAWVNQHFKIPMEFVLAGLLLPLSLLVTVSSRYQAAPLAAALVFFLATPGTTSHFAIERVLSIGLGGLVGATTAFVIFPRRAIKVVRRQLADATRLIGQMLRDAMRGDSPSHTAAQSARNLLHHARANLPAIKRARFIGASHPSATHAIIDVLDHLWFDVTVVQAAASTDASPTADSDKLFEWLSTAADAVARRKLAPPLAAVESTSEPHATRTELDFALVLVSADIQKLATAMNEAAGKSPPKDHQNLRTGPLSDWHATNDE